MSAIILYAKRQAAHTIHSENRRAALLVATLVLFVTGLVLLFQSPGFSVQYDGVQVSIVKPLEAAVCPGGTIHFPVTLTINERKIPGRLQIDEAWCKEGITGTCTGVTPPQPNLPLLEEKRIVAQATRTIPDTLTPGVYHLWHSATSNRGEVSGYIVAPIIVNDCEVPQ